MTTTTTRTTYRIVSRPPGSRRWDYRAFTGAIGSDPVALRERMTRAEEESPGWSFAIESQTVETTTSEWRTVTAEKKGSR